MRICLICVEIFAWGKYGGFGRATRLIGGALAGRGYQVAAVVPRRAGQAPVEDLDGITVYGYSASNPWSSIDLFRACDADIYHSSEPSFATYLAQRAMPGRRHLVTVRDPRDFEDWRMEFTLPSLNRLQVAANYLFESNPLVSRAVRRADAVFSPANSLAPKIKQLYRLPVEPAFLPTPVAVPETVVKADRPTVCYLARLDRRKRPELFFDLAARFPDIRFVAVGASRDPDYERQLREAYAHLPNLEMAGFVDQFASTRHADVLGESWVLVNTASREGLPNAFLEAAAHRCAVLSYVDPDGFASRFGYHASTDDFAAGLETLLRDDAWRRLGGHGHRHVVETFATDRAIDMHVAAYREALS